MKILIVGLSRQNPLTRGLGALCASFRRIQPLQALQEASGCVIAINDSTDFRGVAAFNEAIGAADWVRIAPFGEFPNEVGLQVFDRISAEAIVSAFNSVATKAATLWRGLPIYEGHPDEPAWLRANPGYKRVAVGRVKEVQTREDGLYGKVAFNDAGNALVRGEAPAYEAQSPRWFMKKIAHKSSSACRPFELLSLGLTNQPNIPGTLLGLNEEETNSAMKTHLIALLAALGRPLANAAAVTDEQLAAAVNEALPVATSLVTASNELGTVKPKLTTAEQSLVTANNELAALRTSVATERAARAEAVLLVAINEGRITAAQRAEWLGRFTAVNADFAKVQGELGAVKKAINTQPRVKGIGERKAEEAASASKVTAINEAITEKQKTIPDRGAAYAAVRKEKPELFSNTAAS